MVSEKMTAATPRCSKAVQSAFYKTFYNWGHFVARRPCMVILCSVVLCLALCARLFTVFRNPLPAITEQDKLWVPQDAPAIDAKDRYEAIYQNTFRRNTILFTTSPPGGNVLTKSILEEIRRFDLTVNHELYAWGGKGGDALSKGNVSYEDVCAKSQTAFGANSTAPNCVLFGHPLELWYRVGGIFDFDFSDEEIAAQVESGRGIDERLFPLNSNRTVNTASIFGGVTHDSAGHITGAKAISFTYLLGEAIDGSADRDAAIAWEDQLNYLIGEQWAGDDLSVGSVTHGPLRWSSSIVEMYPQTAGATSRELSKNIRGDLLSVNISYFIILIYAMLIFGRMQPTHSKALLALSGVVGVGMSVAVAYGFTTLFVSLNPVVNVLPFILIGIGVDDMFVLIFALEAEPLELPVKERMARAMGHAGVSITITSITDLVAFLLGTMSQLPALSGFCTFAAIGILADYAFQITFFAGWMALDAHRERKKKIDCCPCCCEAPEVVTGLCCCKCTWDCCSPSVITYGLRPFLVRYYIPCLRSKWTKALVLIGFAALTAFSAYGASQLKQDFQFRWFVNDDAPLQQVFDMQDEYFSETGLPVYVITPPSTEVDYTTTSSQQELLNVGTNAQANQYIERNSLSAWYPLFREWIGSCGDILDNDASMVGGGTCIRRDCQRNFTGTLRLQYPHCSFAKQLRDAEGNHVEELLTYNSMSIRTPLSGSADRKYLVDSTGNELPDGASLSSAYIPPAKYWNWLDQFVKDAPLGGIFNSELVWVNNATVRTPAENALGLHASRMRLTYTGMSDASSQVSSMRTLRTDVEAAKFGSTYPYMFMYLYYEQYAIIGREALLNLGLALVAVVAITLIIIANVGATVLVTVCVILVDIDILGLLWWWGLSIDSVAVINLVLAVGLALDYAVHVAHAFMQTPGTRQERCDKAIEEMGTPVLHGAFSTFLAVVVLSSSKSYIFRVFFKMFFGISLFGVLHGLVLLPVLLSIIGPAYVDHGEADGLPPSKTSKDHVFSQEPNSTSELPTISVTSTTDNSVGRVMVTQGI
uniref:SSD domain-containing protein n=1 Tax=Haptolina brevifila TaxID=156173 RepID=A0A7S2IXU5_9EUKA|mmetsp:Transcript_72965/g.145089  ORF Transcript_72965/g.145089 Transcript_72965/m.145089 type:complete len:1044 (+) Transcript_72965:12-3143(+)|eukprot:CAMPEP_0174699468 /NCGR_PEP_ID=MMETSP1094-20130205/4739_1 /TAXON_ID=156173 /ORGANISM="Chrysochromulina brevifilum, Strain UTEX LB 985" /LENGTH=1043 /DNA_ID=CAMNT_0015896811 /DNA_START=9 /DNA_END=3140 /DNA_ORIENTATION=+